MDRAVGKSTEINILRTFNYYNFNYELMVGQDNSIRFTTQLKNSKFSHCTSSLIVLFIRPWNSNWLFCRANFTVLHLHSCSIVHFSRSWSFIRLFKKTILVLRSSNHLSSFRMFRVSFLFRFCYGTNDFIRWSHGKKIDVLLNVKNSVPINFVNKISWKSWRF